LERSTEAAITAALSVVTGPVNAQMAPAMKELKSAAVTILFRLQPDEPRMMLRPGLGFRSQANRCMNWLISTLDMVPHPQFLKMLILMRKLETSGAGD
jgi:hypothetical protein